MQYRIGSQLVPIFPFGNAQALTLFNDGPSTIYLGSDTSTNIVTGFPLGQGSAIVWDPKSPLYAVAATGQTATMFTVENSGPSSLGTVALMDGSTIQLAPNTNVGLNPGASVGLVPGSTVGLESGASVGLAPNSSVAVSSIPPVTYEYWKCVAADVNAPTLSSGFVYGNEYGMPALVCDVLNTFATATYSSISRYSYLSTDYPFSMTGYIYIGNITQNTQLRVGFGGYCFEINVGYLTLQGNSAGINLTAAVAANWIHFELIAHTSMTRITLNGDPTLRIIAPPFPDSGLNAFEIQCYISGSKTVNPSISNLFLSYPSSIPA